MVRRATITAVVLSTALLAACAARAARIAELKDQPDRFDDRTISVTGVVTSSWGTPLVPYAVYNIDDGSGEITVVSLNRRAPSHGARVRVKGRLSQLATIGTRNVGLHIEERGRKIDRR